MVQIGDKIHIDWMDGELDYIGREGIVKRIDDAGQIYGTWGGCALIPGIDKYYVINN